MQRQMHCRIHSYANDYARVAVAHITTKQLDAAISKLMGANQKPVLFFFF